MKVLNVEIEDGATGADLLQALFGGTNPADGFDDVLSSLYIQMLRLLCWTGLPLIFMKTSSRCHCQFE